MKSHVRDLTKLAVHIYRDATAKCSDSFDARDLLTIKSRIEHEGISFLTISLPDFGKDFDRSLSEGQIDSSRFANFAKRDGSPVFLQGLLSLVFDEGGKINVEPNIASIDGVRQIAYAFKKIQLPCAPEKVRRALETFKINERSFEEPLGEADGAVFRTVSSVLWRSCLYDLDNRLCSISPKHGPGATAEGISGNAKYRCSKWHDRLEPYFPILDTAFVNSNARSSSEFEAVTVVDEADEQPVKVITVPKTLKTPRIIAIEPVCMQYTQQAISKMLTKQLESHPLTAGHINFTDQTINQTHAINSSEDGISATLDMSSASDLVPYELALSMFDSVPDLKDSIASCRSKKAQMPDGSIIELKKFASMGSALCFPIEAMYFYTLCIMALLEKRNLPPTFLNIIKVKNKVYVYGDDIIVPSNDAEIVTHTLQKYYCRVNADKSFAIGNFRESCGMDAYDGNRVVPTYIRRPSPCNKQDANEIISWVKASNQFYLRGYWATSNYMIKHVEAITGRLPVVGDKCAGLGKVSFQRRVTVERQSPNYHCPEVRTWVPGPVYRSDRLDGYPALLKSLLTLENNDSNTIVDRDSKHLRRSARHGAVTLKRRWVRPY